MDAVENALVAQAEIQQSSGHNDNKGEPREMFVRQFLARHIGEHVGIGAGEIIDSETKRGERRNQIDIIIYKRNFPRLHLGGEVSAFLVESVVATIEVKSVLNDDAMEQAISTAKNVKSLRSSTVREFTAGYQPPGILSYVVAYDGPKSMVTAYDWLAPIHKKLGVTVPKLPVRGTERINVASPSIDGVFVLKRGMLCFDNSPATIMNDQHRKADPDKPWYFVQTESTLFHLFLRLTVALCGVEASWLNPAPYIRNDFFEVNLGT